MEENNSLVPQETTDAEAGETTVAVQAEVLPGKAVKTVRLRTVIILCLLLAAALLWGGWTMEKAHRQALEEQAVASFEEGRADGYDEGYADGYDEGEAEGHQAGYAEGKETGLAEGYEKGSTEGYEKAREDLKEEIYQEAYNQGNQEGYTTGYAAGKKEGYSSGYSAGKADGIAQAESTHGRPNTSSSDYSYDAYSGGSGEVYITPTGSKYHSIPKCGNTKSSQKVSLSYALSLGLGACKNCW